MGHKFNVGDVVRPLESTVGKYGVTKYKEMLEGVVTRLISFGEQDIQVKITKHIDKEELESSYPVDSRYFELVTPISADEAFERMLDGSISEEEYLKITKQT